MIMQARDSLYKGDVNGANAALGGLDLALNSLTSSIAEIGSIDSRLNTTAKRISYEKPEFIKANSLEIDLDAAQAIMELKMLEYTHQAALAASARILRPTLLDFLR